MARIVKKSVAPIYLAGGVWLVYAVLFPLYRLSDYLICAVISIACFILGKSIWPDAVLLSRRRMRTKLCPLPSLPPRPGRRKSPPAILSWTASWRTGSGRCPRCAV